MQNIKIKIRASTLFQTRTLPLSHVFPVKEVVEQSHMNRPIPSLQRPSFLQGLDWHWKPTTELQYGRISSEDKLESDPEGFIKD